MSSQPLLPATSTVGSVHLHRPTKRIIAVLAPVVLCLAVIGVLLFGDRPPSTSDPLALANYYLKTTPVIDGHVDFPIQARDVWGNDITKFNLNKKMPGHMDIPRIRSGHVGGLFWSVYTDCHAKQDGPDFLNPSYHVRDTLEQIDVTLNLINKYSDTFKLVGTADEAQAAMRSGKVASFMGVEGGHQIGNSLGVLRQYYRLGVRYMTLTHGCDNSIGDSGGVFEPVKEKWFGLSPFGKEAIKEMNRIGMLVDLSHVSDQTALDALDVTRAPIILSHSAARSLHNISRNVGPEVLKKIGTGKHQVDGVVMVNFYPRFASDQPEKVDVKVIADHVDYLATIMGRAHVGIGSDFDGIDLVPTDLEDVSKYPNLFAELIRRGWSRTDLAKFAGGNILRVLRGAERVAAKLHNQRPSMAVYSKRHDLDGSPDQKQEL